MGLLELVERFDGCHLSSERLSVSNSALRYRITILVGSCRFDYCYCVCIYYLVYKYAFVYKNYLVYKYAFVYKNYLVYKYAFVYKFSVSSSPFRYKKDRKSTRLNSSHVSISY